MLVKVILVDVNPRVVAAWRNTFEDNPEVDIVQGSMLEQPVSAWVTPTNSRGSMDGGLDGVIKKHLGAGIEKAVQAAIRKEYGGTMPVGRATCVPAGEFQPRYLISTPTMVGSSDNISETMNVALACAAAFQAVHFQNMREPGSVRSVALPGLGANTGKVPAEICADLMWTGYNLFREHAFESFEAVYAALQDQLGDLGAMGTSAKKVIVAPAGVVPVPELPPEDEAPPAKQPKIDMDFDDY